MTRINSSKQRFPDLWNIIIGFYIILTMTIPQSNITCAYKKYYENIGAMITFDIFFLET